MGHESEKITETHYGKLTDNERFELFEEIVKNKPAEQYVLTDEAKIALVDGLMAALGRG